MKKALVFFITLLAMACSSLSPEEQAMADAKEAAQKAYDYLLSGNYERFMQYKADADSMPEALRIQLMAAYRQFMAQQNNNQELTSIQVSRAAIDSTQHLIQVFLLLNYGNQSQEEIVVPMVERNGTWRIK